MPGDETRQGGLVGATNDGLARSGRSLRIEKRAELDGPGLQFALLKDELEVIVDTAYYGYESACGQPSARIPFTELAGFLA